LENTASQDGCIASKCNTGSRGTAYIIKKRSPIIKKNKAKEEQFTARRVGKKWRPKPSPSQPEWRLLVQELQI
jgi:hypothetical protein